MNKVIVPNPEKLVQSRGDRPMVKRTIDRSKPKVTLAGEPAADCIPCQQKKLKRQTIHQP
jgi:hypothetical protein